MLSSKFAAARPVDYKLSATHSLETVLSLHRADLSIHHLSDAVPHPFQLAYRNAQRYICSIFV